jgi:hypothetical protein
MSTPIVALSVLFLVGVLFGSLPFVGGFRGLPRWIRIALFMIGLSFLIGATAGVVLHFAESHLSALAYRLFFAHVILIVGMGIGIIFLLIFSGEYFRALRDLDAARRRRLAATDNEAGPRII